MEKYNPNDFQSVLLYLRREYGLSVFREPKRLYGFLCDFAPDLKPYGGVMRRLAEMGALAELCEASYEGGLRLDRAFHKARYLLENELLLGAERVDFFLDALRALYGAAAPAPQAPPSKQQQSNPQPAAPRPVPSFTPQSAASTKASGRPAPRPAPSFTPQSAASTEASWRPAPRPVPSFTPQPAAPSFAPQSAASTEASWRPAPRPVPSFTPQPAAQTASGRSFGDWLSDWNKRRNKKRN